MSEYPGIYIVRERAEKVKKDESLYDLMSKEDIDRILEEALERLSRKDSNNNVALMC